MAVNSSGSTIDVGVYSVFTSAERVSYDAPASSASFVFIMTSCRDTGIAANPLR